MKAIDACDVAGITYRQLDYWLRTGRLRMRDAMPGSGHQRDLPLSEVEIAKRMGTLLRLGFTLDWAHKIARYLVEHDAEACTLSVAGKRRIALQWIPETEEKDDAA